MNTPCVIWAGHIDRHGYGKASGGLAHRIAYAEAFGPIVEGLELDHLCRIKACVNPSHLEPVTRAENMRRRYALQMHCAHGHAFDSINTYYRPDGWRDCRTCIRDRVRRYGHRARRLARSAA